MSHSTISLNTLLNRALINLKRSNELAPEIEAVPKDSAKRQCFALKSTCLGYQQVVNHQAHTLHYAMKGLGYLPLPLLESLVSYLGGPTSKQYLHADAHLRLILAINSKLKTPLELTPMPKLRERFAADAVAMQSPKVWQQTGDTLMNNIKRFRKKGEVSVRWTDKVIANADDGDMTIRCYQPDASTYRKTIKKGSVHNPDETVLLFFHGGGFCIGGIDTHHEFCHALSQQTGWPVVSVDYRLAPEHPAPAALKDCISAYAWLAEHCHMFGALPSRIVLAGDSAGGGLSTLIAQQLTAPAKQAWADLGEAGQDMFALLERLPQPLAQMPLYPVTDIETDYPSWELYGEGLLLDHDDVAVFDAACLKNSPLPRQHILNSPMLGDNSHVCPTYIVTSELDVLRDEAFTYAEQLKTHGISVRNYTVLGAPHGFIHFMSIHQRLGLETRKIIHGFASFVREVIREQGQLAA